MRTLKTCRSLLAIGFIISAIMAQPPTDWTVNPSDFEHVMTVTGSVQINDHQTDSAAVLLDRAAGGNTENQIHKIIKEDGGAIVTDLKVWYLAPNRFAAVLRIKPIHDKTADYYRNLLIKVPGLVYISIEQ